MEKGQFCALFELCTVKIHHFCKHIGKLVLVVCCKDIENRKNTKNEWDRFFTHVFVNIVSVIAKKNE